MDREGNRVLVAGDGSSEGHSPATTQSPSRTQAHPTQEFLALSGMVDRSPGLKREGRGKGMTGAAGFVRQMLALVLGKPGLATSHHGTKAWFPHLKTWSNPNHVLPGLPCWESSPCGGMTLRAQQVPLLELWRLCG